MYETTTKRVSTAVYAADPILRSGIRQQLGHRAEVELLADAERERADVALVVIDRIGDDALRLLRHLQHGGPARRALVVGQVDRDALGTAIECGIAAVLRRSDAGSDQLVTLLTAVAHGEGVLPGDLIGELIHQMGRLRREVLEPNGLTLSALSTREVDVLRLLSEGFDTAEIASKISYSERTVKNVLQEITTRLDLRNRAHAVGYAMRQGLI